LKSGISNLTSSVQNANTTREEEEEEDDDDDTDSPNLLQTITSAIRNGTRDDLDDDDDNAAGLAFSIDHSMYAAVVGTVVASALLF